MYLYVRIVLYIFDGKWDEFERKKSPLTEQCGLDFSRVKASDNFQGQIYVSWGRHLVYQGKPFYDGEIDEV